jgi:hypothetical protein
MLFSISVVMFCLHSDFGHAANRETKKSADPIKLRKGFRKEILEGAEVRMPASTRDKPKAGAK